MKKGDTNEAARSIADKESSATREYFSSKERETVPRGEADLCLSISAVKHDRAEQLKDFFDRVFAKTNKPWF